MDRRVFLRWSAMGASLVSLGASAIGSPIALAADAKGWPASAFAATNVNELLHELFHLRSVPESSTVRLQITGPMDEQRIVPVSVAVDHPMREDDHIVRIYMIVDSNPQPLASIFHCGPKNGRAACYQRVQVHQDGPIRAIAESNRGDLFASAALTVSSPQGGKK